MDHETCAHDSPCHLPSAESCCVVACCAACVCACAWLSATVVVLLGEPLAGAGAGAMRIGLLRGAVAVVGGAPKLFCALVVVEMACVGPPDVGTIA